MSTSLFIPGNETSLYSSGFRNGSLFGQIQLYITRIRDYGYDRHVNLTVLPNNFASITFNSSDGKSALAFPLLEALLDYNATRVIVPCVYPLSGQYDTLSRALFYVLLVFALVFRRHIWISSAALGTAMTYAAVSAIHLFALIATFGWEPFPASNAVSAPFGNIDSSQAYGDFDIYGVFPILTTSAIMLAPIIMWSTTVRKHRIQAIVIYWGILIFVALLCAIYVLLKTGDEVPSNILLSIGLCDKTPECVQDQPVGPTWGDLFVSADYYSKCNCADFCGVFGPSAPMRKGANMVPWLDFGRLASLSQTFINLVYVGIFAIVYIAANGMIGILQIYSSQEAARNFIFRFLNNGIWLGSEGFSGEQSQRLEQLDLRSKVLRKWRYVFAKGVAASLFLGALFLTILCPLVFIVTVIEFEIIIQGLPVSEYSDAVGAWSTWVGAILLILAAVIEKRKAAWWEAFVATLSAIRRIFHSTTNREVQSDVELYNDSNPCLRMSKEEITLYGKLKPLFEVLASPFIHGWDSMRRAFWKAKAVLRFFIIWWRNTEIVSQQREDDISKAWFEEGTKNPGGKPPCRCRICKQDAEEKDSATKDEDSKPFVWDEADIVRNFSTPPRYPPIRQVSLDNRSFVSIHEKYSNLLFADGKGMS